MAAESYAAADLVDRPFVDLFAPGEPLSVRLGCGQAFEGALERAGRDRLELRDVRESGNPNSFARPFTFYRNEIERIERIRPREVANEAPDGGSVVKMDEEEYRRLKEVAREYVYVDECEKERDLSEYESLGVQALGLLPAIGLLVIGAWDRVFIYDLLRLGRLTEALRTVLESRRVRKVLHRAGPTVEALRRRYDTTVRNYFDTETADMVVQKGGRSHGSNGTEEMKLPVSRDLSQCLVAYLNFPPSLLREALLTRREKWSHVRPLSERRLLYASQLVTYLIPLRDEMRRSAFGHVTETSETVCDYVYDLDTFRFNRQRQESNVVDEEMDALIPKF